MTNYWRLITYCPDLYLFGGTARKLAVPILLYLIIYLFNHRTYGAKEYNAMVSLI